MSQLPGTNISIDEEEEEEEQQPRRVRRFGEISGAMMDALARSHRRRRSKMTDVMMDARVATLKRTSEFAGALKDQIEQELPEGEDGITEPGTMTRIGSAIWQAQRLSIRSGRPV